MSYSKEEMIERERIYQQRYREKYPERVKLTKAKSREKYKDQIGAPHLCICGLTVRHNNIQRHMKTQKHFDHICIKYQK